MDKLTSSSTISKTGIENSELQDSDISLAVIPPKSTRPPGGTEYVGDFSSVLVPMLILYLIILFAVSWAGYRFFRKSR
ncbi:hypothetical protein [Flagellimonas nanhaiensis]|uniref:Uncharacterized protein n=1 Tax=Flagellimonas nanhaiensis TaxID=2292706 RepID=A0A371JKT2_9FLAO|nr:hypothetical protein [Allomuricauda nanhaiensis]RDY57560.1 hypothetical protein DX873_18550 [Allomuricauda nanhaiensis]